METRNNSSLALNPSNKMIENEKIVSYSRNIFLPITNLCRNDCAYCGFQKEPGEEAWIMSRDEVLNLAEKGLDEGCSEALITLGERPEKYEMMKRFLEKEGYESTVEYLTDLSREILNLGILPHTNPGVVEMEELKELRKWNASMGLMLECASKLPVHKNSPGKDPNLRIEMIEKAGELKIPFTTGILVGIGEDQKTREKSLEKIKEIHEKFGHIQEVIIQPFIPKKGTPMENEDSPPSQTVLKTLKLAQEIMPEMKLQIPPNLVPNIKDFLKAGLNDLGGISEVTPDFINPGNPWPKISELKSSLREEGFRLKERLPIHSKYALNSKFMSSEVEKVVGELTGEDGYRRNEIDG